MTTRTREHDDLPILDEIGRDLSAAFAREEAGRVRRRRSRRLRGVAVLTAALFVAGPGSVVATRWIWAPDPGELAPGRPFEGSKPIQVGDVRTEFATWRISAFMGDRGLCWQSATFTVTESGGKGVICLADLPETSRMAPSSNLGEGEAVYIGWAPPSAARVTVVDGNGRHLPAKVVVTPPDRIRLANLPAGLKFYVASGPPISSLPRPPAAVAFDAAGREIERFTPPASPSR